MNDVRKLWRLKNIKKIRAYNRRWMREKRKDKVWREGELAKQRARSGSISKGSGSTA